MTKVEAEIGSTRDQTKRLLEFRTAAIDCAIALVSILPLLLTGHLPLTDLPDHLARQYILRDLAHSPILQSFYEVHWALVPNLALEFFVFGARHLMSIDQAVRSFCITTILMLFFGARLINRSLGGARSKIYRVAPLLCYGGPFQFGFLSFCFGMGLALVLFGYYLRFRQQRLARLVAVFVPCSFALLLCHLAAFGIFAAAIGSSELAFAFTLANGWSRGLLASVLTRETRVACCLMPAIALFGAFGPTTITGHEMRFSTILEKIEGIAAITLFSSPGAELALLLLGMTALLAALLGRVVRLHRDAAALGVFLLIVWLVLPRVALGGGYVDYRVPWASSFFMLSMLVPGSRYDRCASLFGGGIAVLALGRIALISWLWLEWEPTLAAIDNALAQLPAGTRLMVVEGVPSSTSVSRRPPLDHVAAYAVARSSAFDPNMFSSFSGQILYFHGQYKRLWKLSAPSELDQLAPEYSYVLVLRPALARILPRLTLVCETSGRDFELLRVVASKGVPLEPRQSGTCSGSGSRRTIERPPLVNQPL